MNDNQDSLLLNYNVDGKKNMLKEKCRTASTQALIARNATTVTVQANWLLVCRFIFFYLIFLEVLDFLEDQSL